MASPYVFRPMTADDMPLVRRWLAEPHVAEWWHDPEALVFRGRDRDDPDLGQFIVGLGEHPRGTRDID